MKDSAFQLPAFLASENKLRKGMIALGGIPYDCTASFRPGTRFAMREIRNYSLEAVEEYSFTLEKSLEDVHFCDIGDLPVLVGSPEMMVKFVQENVSKILNNGNRFLGIGGEHLVTYPLFLAHKEIYGDFTLLHLDAHADLREGYLGDKLSHASVMKLCLDAGLQKLIQVGIRSGTAAEYKLRKNDKRIRAVDLVRDLPELINPHEKIYLSVDVDYFDPAYVPGTGTPEAGGYSYNDFLNILQILLSKKVQIIGADVVELLPDADQSKISTAFCVKLIRDLLIVMSAAK